MHVARHLLRHDGTWVPPLIPSGADLVLVFLPRALAEDPAIPAELLRAFPAAVIAGCTTAGQVVDTAIVDADAVVTLVRFQGARVRSAVAEVGGSEGAEAAGNALARALLSPDLRAILVFSEGLRVNGSALVRGLSAPLPREVVVSGGLSADGDAFERTLVWTGRRFEPGFVAAVGLYGDGLRVGCGALGGWDPFGPERVVTRAEGNIVYTLDGEPALALYRRYLGAHAAGLPASALLFPLAVREADGMLRVRTVLGTDEVQGAMVFAGEVPQGAIARLMKANFDRLVDGAQGAAQAGVAALGAQAELAVVVSCWGRRLVLKQRTEEELEAVRAVLGEQAVVAGFYSYGELAPFAPQATCELQNQTLTLLALAEG